MAGPDAVNLIVALQMDFCNLRGCTWAEGFVVGDMIDLSMISVECWLVQIPPCLPLSPREWRMDGKGFLAPCDREVQAVWLSEPQTAVKHGSTRWQPHHSMRIGAMRS